MPKEVQNTKKRYEIPKYGMRYRRDNSDNNKLLSTNVELDHIQSSDAVACRVAMANYDYSDVNSEPIPKKAKIDIASVTDGDHHTPTVTFPDSTL
jgi:hypothetical protein